MVCSERLPYEVVICTYNGARFLKSQLTSIIDQTWPPIRLSIYDDDSSDNTISVVEQVRDELACTQKCVIAIYRNVHNLGYARNFQQALEYVTEEFVFLCDQDDIWIPTKAEKLLTLMRDTGADLAFSDGIPVDEWERAIGSGTVLHSYGLDAKNIHRFNLAPFDFLVKRNYVNGAAAVIRRQAGKAALPIPPDIPHDYWLAIWAAAHGGIVCTSECLYYYRQHGANVIGLSAGSIVDLLRSAWRYPVAPRRRELEIWRAVASRSDENWPPSILQAIANKLGWMEERFAIAETRLILLRWVLVSIISGRYAALSIGRSLLRDVAALFPRDPR